MYEVILRVIHDTSGLYSIGDVTDRPCPTITIGINSVNANHYRVEFEHRNTPPRAMPTDTSKPPYRVQSMAETDAKPPNGYRMISTFSGCGGSCLGFRMDGYTTLWASEFIQPARDVYKLNHPGVTVDGRDIRLVMPEEILKEAGVSAGEIDVLEGSPPCASFSTAGNRSGDWGKVKKYSETKQRTDDLFWEFARIVDGIKPKVFVAENVSGLVKGVAKGYFKMIMKRLKECGYEVKCRVLDAQWLGVPQQRQRTIFVGVRNDLVERYDVHPCHPSPLPYRYSVRDALPWITKIVSGDPAHNKKPGSGWSRGSELDVDKPCLTVQQTEAVINGSSSTVEGDISKYAIGDEWDKVQQGTSSDKYLNLSKPHPDKPCGTITQLGGVASVASVVHPTEKRKFTIVELKRICGFPDDFKLSGTYAQQWERLGRAVPPPMMLSVARVIRTEILDKCVG